MCGIIGTITTKRYDRDKFIHIRDQMFHRGPDDAGIWQNCEQTVCLGHRRLSILDLSPAGQQPIVSDCGRYVIVFNGEVYNYVELKSELEALGYRFKGHSDTEVILVAYIAWGEKCLKRFNGMFAIAIWDNGNEQNAPLLFLARDRAGKKPLYYAQKQQQLVFASELKLIAHPYRGELSLNSINHYLALGYIPNDLALTDGVNKLSAAHALRFFPRNGKLEKWCWWQLPDFNFNSTSHVEELTETSWLLLLDSVKLRMRSDVPVGVFLSGGLDSSLITAAAAKVTTSRINTFTIGVPGSVLDESHHARFVSDHFATQHHLLELPNRSLDVFDELAPYIDEPIADSSIIPSFQISKLTRQHVTVALGGDGGDEIFGGYRHYQKALTDQQQFGAIAERFLKPLAQLARYLPAGVRGRNYLAAMVHGPRQAPIWGTPYFDAVLRARLLTPHALDGLGDHLIQPEANQLGLMDTGYNLVDGLMRMDFQSVMVDDYLVKVDRSSMVNSLEVRSPFLDYRLIEYAYRTIPSEWKVNLTERRRIQNRMATHYLPKGFVLNRKQGFSIPMDEWLRCSDIRTRLDALPKSMFNFKEIDALIKGLHRGRANGARLFSLISLAMSLQNLGYD